MGLQMQTEPGRRSFRFLKLIFRQDAFPPPPLPPPVNKLHPEPSLAVFVFLRGGTVSKYEANSFGSRKGRPDTEREVGGGGPDPGSPPPHPPLPQFLLLLLASSEEAQRTRFCPVCGLAASDPAGLGWDRGEIKKG